MDAELVTLPYQPNSRVFAYSTEPPVCVVSWEGEPLSPLKKMRCRSQFDHFAPSVWLGRPRAGCMVVKDEGFIRSFHP